MMSDMLKLQQLDANQNTNPQSLKSKMTMFLLLL
jgi:hypothetical protein